MEWGRGRMTHLNLKRAADLRPGDVIRIVEDDYPADLIDVYPAGEGFMCLVWGVDDADQATVGAETALHVFPERVPC